MSKAAQHAKVKEICSGCKTQPVRAPGQRYCKECHNEAENIRRKQLRDDAELYRKIVRGSV